jgi:trimethylamine:corrinoid methyltransferase-like protein
MKKSYEECTLGYSILEKKDLDAIHESTLKLMEEFGVRVFGDQAHEIYSAAGCHVDRETNMVRFPRNLVNDCIESAPAEYTLYARNPEKSFGIGGKKVTYTNFGTGVYILDPYTGERRSTTKEDLCNIARFIDAVYEVDCITIPVAATDVPEEIKELHEAEAIFHNTSKHFGHDTDGGENTRRFIRMAAAVAGGMDQLREKPIVSLGACPNSPLELHEAATPSAVARTTPSSHVLFLRFMIDSWLNVNARGSCHCSRQARGHTRTAGRTAVDSAHPHELERRRGRWLEDVPGDGGCAQWMSSSLRDERSAQYRCSAQRSGFPDGRG